MKTYIQPPLKCDPDRVIIHVGTNDLRSSQDPETIAKNIIDIAKNSTTKKNEILVSSIVPRRDNLNGKGRQVNNILQKLCVENNFAYLNHDNIRAREHCNYGGVHLNTSGSKILAESFILALSRQTPLGIMRDNDALIRNVSETESSSETTTLESLIIVPLRLLIFQLFFHPGNLHSNPLLLIFSHFCSHF